MIVNELRPLDGYPAAIGFALAAMSDARQRTLDTVAGLAEGEVDATVSGFPNSVGATLYHLAAIEADWLYSDLLEEDYPDWLADVFPFDVREHDGMLSVAPGFTAAQHLDRLALVRDRFLTDIVRLDPSRFDLPNRVETSPSTPRWIFHHLNQHEAEHRGQMQSILTALRTATPE